MQQAKTYQNVAHSSNENVTHLKILTSKYPKSSRIPRAQEGPIKGQAGGSLPSTVVEVGLTVASDKRPVGDARLTFFPIPKNICVNRIDLLASQEMKYGSFSGISLPVFKLPSFRMEIPQCPP